MKNPKKELLMQVLKYFPNDDRNETNKILNDILKARAAEKMIEDNALWAEELELKLSYNEFKQRKSK